MSDTLAMEETKARLWAACRAGSVDEVTSVLRKHDADQLGMFIDAQDMSSEFKEANYESSV
jgi:hypothetical protein